MELIIAIVVLSAILGLLEMFCNKILYVSGEHTKPTPKLNMFLTILKRLISAAILIILFIYLIINYLTVALLILLVVFTIITTITGCKKENKIEMMIPMAITIGLFTIVLLKLFVII